MAKGRKQPRTTCPSCGKQLSQQALKRHRGTPKCLEGYAKRLVQPRHAVPQGMKVMWWHDLNAARRLLRDAGISPEDSPVQPAVVWHPGGDGPTMQWLAPAWFAIGVVGVVDLVEERERAEATITHGKALPMAYLKKTVEQAKRDKAKLDVQIGVATADLLTVLGADLSAEDQLGLAAELHICAHAPAEASDAYKPDEVRRVMRRTASRLLGDGTE